MQRIFAVVLSVLIQQILAFNGRQMVRAGGLLLVELSCNFEMLLVDRMFLVIEARRR